MKNLLNLLRLLLSIKIKFICGTTTIEYKSLTLVISDKSFIVSAEKDVEIISGHDLLLNPKEWVCIKSDRESIEVAEKLIKDHEIKKQRSRCPV